MKIIKYIVILFILTNCSLFRPELKNKPKSDDEYFFPSLNFPYSYPMPNDSVLEFVNNWYSKHLKSLKEPILYNQVYTGQNIIRFTHLGTLSKPYSYRIENNNEKIIGVYNKTNGRGGYQSGRRIKHKQKELLQSDWELIIAGIDNIDFWNIQTHDTNTIGDGSKWILEVLINEKYHFVTRSSPDSYGGEKYADLCELIKKVFEE